MPVQRSTDKSGRIFPFPQSLREVEERRTRFYFSQWSQSREKNAVFVRWRVCHIKQYRVSQLILLRDRSHRLSETLHVFPSLAPAVDFPTLGYRLHVFARLAPVTGLISTLRYSHLWWLARFSTHQTKVFWQLAEPIRYLLAYTGIKCQYCDYVTGDGKSWPLSIQKR